MLKNKQSMKIKYRSQKVQAEQSKPQSKRSENEPGRNIKKYSGILGSIVFLLFFCLLAAVMSPLRSTFRN